MRSEESNVHIVMLSLVIYLLVLFYMLKSLLQTVSAIVTLIKDVLPRGDYLKRDGLQCGEISVFNCLC